MSPFSPFRLGADDTTVCVLTEPIQPSLVVVGGGVAPLDSRSRRRAMTRSLIFLRLSWAFNELVRAMTCLRQEDGGQSLTRL